MTYYLSSWIIYQNSSSNFGHIISIYSTFDLFNFFTGQILRFCQGSFNIIIKEIQTLLWLKTEWTLIYKNLHKREPASLEFQVQTEKNLGQTCHTVLYALSSIFDNLEVNPSDV